MPSRYLSIHPIANHFCYETAIISFFYHCDTVHRDLHSFPTRRSSDLADLRDCPPSAARASRGAAADRLARSEEHTSELQSHSDLVCRLLLEKKNVAVDAFHQPHILLYWPIVQLQ